MLSLVRALLVLVSLFLVFHVSEAGLLRERLLGRSKMDDMYRGQSFDAKRFDEWLGKRPERVQTEVDQERDDHRAKFPSTELYRRQKYYQCRFAACGK